MEDTSWVENLSLYIRFLDLELFCKSGGFIKCPECVNNTVLLSQIDRNESLLVFISHCWLRPAVGCDDWDESIGPHPDNRSGDKWKLCCEGIRWLKQWLAPQMKHCYVWLDYSCIDQVNRANMHRSFKCYDKIVALCDLIFTPIVDNDLTWDFAYFGDTITNYKAKLWNSDHPQAYLSRGWCRVEMLYAANLPVIGNTNGIARHSLFKAGLAMACEGNRRPHWLFGSREAGMRGPHPLSPLQNSYFETYHPMKGLVSVEGDKVHINNLIKDLEKVAGSRLKAVYNGDVNAFDEPHGVGVMTYADGSVYSGHWNNGKKEGQGSWKTTDGNSYVGNWLADQKHGRGVCNFSDGAVYEGEFCEGFIEGTGIYRYANGEVYEGGWLKTMKHGFGTFYYRYEGCVFAGEWAKGAHEGFGRLTDASGNRCEGYFKDRGREVTGKCTFVNGVVEEGVWKRSDVRGASIFLCVSGSGNDFEFKNGVIVPRT